MNTTPVQFLSTPYLPVLHFTDIRLFYELLDPELPTPYWLYSLAPVERSALPLPYNQNHLEFEFLGIVQFQWRR